MIQLRRTFPYFGTVFKIAKPYFRTMSAKKYHGMPRMLCQPRSNIFYKCNYFFSSLRSKSRVYKEAEEMYKLYGWS